MKDVIVRARWCQLCGREMDHDACARCNKPTTDLGYRVGDSYYSSLDTMPRHCRERFDTTCANGHPRSTNSFTDGRGRLGCRACARDRQRKRRVVTADAPITAGQRL